jgi:hypothetical protein
VGKIIYYTESRTVSLYVGHQQPQMKSANEARLPDSAITRYLCENKFKINRSRQAPAGRSQCLLFIFFFPKT